MKRVYLLFLILTVFLNCSLARATVIPDKNLAAAVRAQLGLDPNAPIFEKDLRVLKHLFAMRRSIKNLTGLENAINLQKLWLEGNEITNITPLADLTQLTYLEFGSNAISDISVLGNLKYLIQLDIQKNPIQGMSAIRELRKQIPNLKIMESDR